MKRIVAVTGEYQNQQGEQKAEFTNIGVIGVSQQGKEYVILDPAISLSGVLAKQQALAMKRGEELKSNIMCSVFENTQQGQQAPQQQGGYQQQRPQQNNYQQARQGGAQQSSQQRPSTSPTPQSEANLDFDDDIPFAPIGLQYRSLLLSC